MKISSAWCLSAGDENRDLPSKKWQVHLDAVMWQEHRAGEMTFVDYAGQTVPVTDPRTGQVCQAEVFVAVLGAKDRVDRLRVKA